MSNDVILDHLLQQTNTLGKIEQSLKGVDERLKEGDLDLKQIQEQLRTKATKDDVHNFVDVGISEHEQAFHPTKEEEVGRKVIGFKDTMLHTKKGQTVSGLSILAAAITLLELMGVI